MQELLTNVPGFTQKEFRLAASSAASAAARGKTSFRFFTGLVEEVSNRDLDPEQVKQSVLFFSARRGIGETYPGDRSLEGFGG